MIVDWGREVCDRFETAEAREWPCTNGTGISALRSGAASGRMSLRIVSQ